MCVRVQEYRGALQFSIPGFTVGLLIFSTVPVANFPSVCVLCISAFFCVSCRVMSSTPAPAVLLPCSCRVPLVIVFYITHKIGNNYKFVNPNYHVYIITLYIIVTCTVHDPILIYVYYYMVRVCVCVCVCSCTVKRQSHTESILFFVT